MSLGACFLIGFILYSWGLDREREHNQSALVGSPGRAEAYDKNLDYEAMNELDENGHAWDHGWDDV